jgi:hypothetical protein
LVVLRRVQTKTPAKPLKPSTKQTAPKPRAALGGSKKKSTKVLKEIDENGIDDVVDVDLGQDSDVEPAPLAEKIALQAKGKDKTATEMYQKVHLCESYKTQYTHRTTCAIPS